MARPLYIPKAKPHIRRAKVEGVSPEGRWFWCAFMRRQSCMPIVITFSLEKCMQVLARKTPRSRHYA